MDNRLASAALWAALAVCLVAADEYVIYPGAPREFAPVAYTTSQEELEAVVSQVLAHDEPGDSGEVLLPPSGVTELNFEMEQVPQASPPYQELVRYARHPLGGLMSAREAIELPSESYYRSPHDYLRPVVVMRKEPQMYPRGGGGGSGGDWALAPVETLNRKSVLLGDHRDWQVKHIVAKPAVAAGPSHWERDHVVSEPVYVEKYAELKPHAEDKYQVWAPNYVDPYKPVYVHKPRYLETEYVNAEEKHSVWPSNYVNRKTILVEKSVGSDLHHKPILVDEHRDWEILSRPVHEKKYLAPIGYGYRPVGPQVPRKELLVPFNRLPPNQYVIEHVDNEDELKPEIVTPDHGEEGETLVVTTKEVEQEAGGKTDSHLETDNVESIIAEEEDKPIIEEAKESSLKEDQQGTQNGPKE